MPMIIVLAWLDEIQVFNGRPYAADLGARPGMRMQLQAKAVTWLLAGTEADVEKARAHIKQQEPSTGRVYVYETSEQEPLKRAREDVLCGRPGR